VTFFLDNMISPKFAKALRALGEDVYALRERFAEDTSDEEWLRRIGGEGWPLVTADKHILSRPHELQALKEAEVTTFFLGPFFATKTQFWDQAVWLIRNWPKLRQTAQTFKKGSCFSVSQRGKLRSLSVV